MAGDTFASRLEQKYLLTGSQWAAFSPILTRFMRADAYGETTVCNLYLDTPEDLLTRRSMEKPDFKEKLRLRSYGIPTLEQTVYLEIKKKLGGVVYKRRAACPLSAAMAYLQTAVPPEGAGQVFREIDVLMKQLQLSPRVYLAYDRCAYEEKNGGGLRLTIDRNLRFRHEDLELTQGDAGKLALDAASRLMEVKSLGGLPLWLTDALSTCRVFPVSFSKIGQVYMQTNQPQRSYASCSQAFSLPLRVPAFPRLLR